MVRKRERERREREREKTANFAFHNSKKLVQISSNFLHSISTSISLRKCNKNWGSFLAIFWKKPWAIAWKKAWGRFVNSIDFSRAIADARFNS